MPRAIILPRSIILSLTILLPRALLPLHFPSSYPPLPPLVIHEFDPWFNYRATEYLDENGAAKFFTWFDYMSWYPLGRPVGTTIYPGLQLTSVFIKNTLANTPYALSLNDVCCYVPAWFGAIASALTGLLCYTVTGNKSATVFTTGIMAIVPAHLMRSIGGGYDNESIAVAAMVRESEHLDHSPFSLSTCM